MRVALNLLYLRPGEAWGTDTYARRLIEALDEVGGDDEFTIFLNHNTVFRVPPGVEVVRVRLPKSLPGVRYLWEQLLLPWKLRSFDVLHSPGYVGPVVSPCPQVVTVHDANFSRIPMRPIRRRVLHWLVGVVARRAAAVITPSAFSARELEEVLGLPADCFRVVPSGPGRFVHKSAAAGPRDLPSEYLVAFSDGLPHKNIDRLIAALATLDQAPPLVLIGSDPGSRTDEQVIRLGPLSDSEAAAVLAGATLLAFPSTYEGFGFPLLEAQAMGIPVVCSRTAALPETGGVGAVYFDPESVDDIGNKISATLNRDEQRQQVVAAGFDNVKRFDWRRTAEDTLAVYAEAATNARERSGR